MKHLRKFNEDINNEDKEYYCLFLYGKNKFSINLEKGVFKSKSANHITIQFTTGDNIAIEVNDDFLFSFKRYNLSLSSLEDDITKIKRDAFNHMENLTYNEAFLYDSKEKAFEAYNYLYTFISSKYKKVISNTKDALSELEDKRDEYIKKYNL